MSIKRIVIYISIIVSVLSVVSCKEEFPTLEDFAEYSKYLENGDLEGVKKYYKKFGPRSVEQYGVEGLFMINPLEVSLYYNHYDVAEFLLKKGANVNIIVPSINNYLFTAMIVNEKKDALRLLLKYGLDVNAKSINGETVLWYAARSGDIDILNWIVNKVKNINQLNDDKENALTGAVYSGNMDCVRLLMEKGININNIDNNGDTALFYSVYLKYIEISEYLIEHGADINIVDNEGYDAKWFADELGLQIKGLTY